MSEELVQAALQGDEQAIQQIVMAAMQGDEQATALLEQAQQAAEQGDQNAAQFVQAAMQVAQQMQSQAQAARQGAKIQYLRHLRRECAPGEKLVYFKAGGKVCKKCQKIEEAKCGKKMSKKACGGKAISKFMAEYKENGGLINKYAEGGDPTEKPGKVSKNGIYTVVKGDSLYKIAQNNGCSVQDLVAANRDLLKNGIHSVIHPGDKIDIKVDNYRFDVSGGKNENPKTVGHRQQYIVQSGDSWWKIAQKFKSNYDSGTSILQIIKDLKERNDWKRKGDMLYPGEVIYFAK